MIQALHLFRSRTSKWLQWLLLLTATHLLITLTCGIGNIFWESQWIDEALDVVNAIVFLLYFVGNILIYMFQTLPLRKKAKDAYDSMMESRAELVKMGVTLSDPLPFLKTTWVEKIIFPLVGIAMLFQFVYYLREVFS